LTNAQNIQKTVKRLPESPMKRQILWIIIPLCIVLFPSNQISHAADLTLNNTPTQVCFSPQGGCTEAIVGVINGAKTEVLVQATMLKSEI
jgi:hypothetical protein